MSARTSHVRSSSLLLLPLFQFLLRYRRTAIGPAWLFVGPALFIGLLGLLYAEIGSIPARVFVPHLAVGLVVWSLISLFVTQSATVYQRSRSTILQGAASLREIAIMEVVTTVILFAHQALICAVVFLIYQRNLTWIALESLLGLAVLIATGVWTTRLFGILGARYRDLVEVFNAIMRIAFLATPIMWMPGDAAQGGVMMHFLAFNPFHHFIEVIRAPLLGEPAAPMSWAVVTVLAFVCFLADRLVAASYARYVSLWI